MEPLDDHHTHRRWLVVALAVAVAVLVTVYLRQRDEQQKDERYRSEAADRGDITMTVSATGTVSPVTTVQVGSQVSGIIARLHADFNSHVRQGELLAELDPTPFQQQVDQRRAEVTKARVEAANAELTYTRQRRLFEAGVVSRAEVDSARAAHDASRAQLALSQATLKQAETNLGYTRIYSPVEGEVVARQYDVGQTVAASFQAPTLFIIAEDLTRMQVEADVDQSDIGQVAVGETARFTVDAYPEQEFRGRVSQVRLNATVNQNVITYPVIVEVANPEGKLRPSMTANVTLEVATVRDALRVPNAALRFRPESTEKAAAGQTAVQRASPGAAGAKRGQTIYVLGERNALRPAAIRTGITDGHYTQVVSGELRAGDRLVTGLATAKVNQSGTSNSRPPMGRF